MIPGMDLASQYDKTLQNTIGQSQRQRNEALNQPQGDVTDWAQRGASGFRGAGYNEVNPSTMPAMDKTTRNNLAPILGTYQEGGQNKEGYYGDLNPYTVEGALKYASNAGFTGADSTLQQQAKETGSTLPSLFGHSLANDAARTWGKDYGNWKTQNDAYQTEANRIPNLIKDLQSKISPELAPKLINGDQIDYYVNRGFVPGQDNGENWKWREGMPQSLQMLAGGSKYDPTSNADYQERLNLYKMGLLTESPEIPKISEGDQWQNDAYDYFNSMYPKGSGSWDYYKDGKYVDMRGLEYSPITGFHMPKEEKLKGNPGSWMPALTQAVMSVINPAAGAMMSTARTGLNTGDWKNAVGQGALSYLGSSLGGSYGGDLGGAMGLSGELAKGVGSGLISTGVNTAGNLALGNKVDWGNVAGGLVGSIGGNYLGGLANSGVGGGTVGNAVGGGVRSLASGLASSAFSGNGINAQDLATRTALGAAAPTLGNLFSDTSATPDDRNQNTKLASTGLNLANTLYKNNKRL